MKKTQSLKLMLLGLFAAVSTGAWAQFTAEKGVVYDISGAKAKVVGVLANLPDGEYGDGRYLAGTKSIQIEDVIAGKKVDALDKNWKNAGSFATTPQQGQAGTNQDPADPGLNDGSQWVVTPGTNGTAPTGQSVYTTVDATQISAVELVFRASEITEISYDDIKGLHVAGFILGGTSGITVIPDDLFAPVRFVNQIPNEAKAEEIARLNALINGSTQYYAPKGIYGSQQVYESNNVSGFYFVVNTGEQTTMNGEFVNAAYQISQEEGKAPKVAESKYVWVRIDPETGNLIAANGTGWQNNYAKPVTTDLFPYGVKGLATIAQEKSDAYAVYDEEGNLVGGALYDYEQAKKATIQAAAAVADPTYGYDPAAVATSAKAQALIDAINAFSTTNATSWGLLQAHIATDLLNNVTLPDAWYAAYVLATIDNWATEMPSLTDADKTYVGNKTAGLVKNFIDAYVAYYGFAPQALQKTEVQAYNFTSYAAAGNIFDNFASSENLHQLATGIVEDRSTDTADPDAVITINSTGKKYYKVKVLQNSVDAANWEGKAFYVQLPEDKSIITDTYYVLYTAEAPAEGSSDPTMKPVTFETQVVTSITPGQETSEEVQLVGTWDAESKVFRATFPNDTELKLSLKSDAYNGLVPNCYVKVGEGDDILVNKTFKVTEEGATWNGTYLVGEDGKLYKQTDDANWTVETVEGVDYRYKNAMAITMTKTTPATPTENTTTETATIVVNINPTPEAYEYTLSPKDQKPSIDAADPREELATKVIKYKSDDERQTAYETAVNNEAAKKTAKETAEREKNAANLELTGAQNDLKTVQQNLDRNWPDYLTGYVYDKDGKNEDLYKGAFNNDVVSVGNHAFAQCVNAKFDGTFRKNLQKIGKEAFLNTLFENLDLSQTGQTDWRGGEPDEDGNPTPDGKIDINDRLNWSRVNPDIQDDAFKGTPLKTMLLATTNVGDLWVKNVVRSIKFEDDVEFTDACGDKYTRDNLNLTLTTVTLPTSDANVEADELEFDWIQDQTFMNCIALTAITIPAQVEWIANQAFYGCDALATITFAATDSQLEYIGQSAFNGTAAASIDLSAQKKLGIVRVPPFLARGIGAYAFANMPELTTVKLENTALITLPATVFQNDAKLATVTFFDASAQKPEETTAITSLPEGLFQTNAIANLDLSKTQITTLENLFKANPEKYPVYDCDGNEIGTADHINRTLLTFTLPENLEKIEDFALSSLWGLTYSKADPFIIPGTVNELGEGVFYNDKNLVAVKAIDSELTYLPERTFAQCTNLEEVTLVTFETLLPIAFGDKCFFSTKTPDVYVNNDTYELLGANFFEGSYATLKPYAPVIQTIQLGNLYFKPWTSKYGTWVEATDNVGVYTAYQNGSKISLYPAKKSTFVGKDGVRRDYYKIAAYDKDADPFVEIIPSLSPRPGAEPTTKLWSAPAQIDYLLTSRMTFNRSGQYGEGISPTYVDGVPTMPMLEYSDNFSDEVLEKTWLALGTAIIVSNQPDAVPYLQKTNPWQKYQSTLDLANQLCVAKEDIPADNNTNFYFLAEQDGTYKFIHHNDETAVPFIPENAVIFMQDPVYGHLGLARDFDIEFVGEGEATAINGVVERSLNDSEAIFNVQGVRVNAPVKGQMYIQGGKKFIQK